MHPGVRQKSKLGILIKERPYISTYAYIAAYIVLFALMALTLKKYNEYTEQTRTPAVLSYSTEPVCIQDVSSRQADVNGSKETYQMSCTIDRSKLDQPPVDLKISVTTTRKYSSD